MKKKKSTQGAKRVEPVFDVGLTQDVIPWVLPAGWQSVNANTFTRTDGLSVITSGERVGEQQWLHVSCSRLSALPSWEDVRQVKDIFIGRKAQAVQILPPEDEYVNDHPYCLHLWSRLDAPTVPDMRRGGTI